MRIEESKICDDTQIDWSRTRPSRSLKGNPLSQCRPDSGEAYGKAEETKKTGQANLFQIIRRFHHRKPHRNPKFATGPAMMTQGKNGDIVRTKRCASHRNRDVRQSDVRHQILAVSPKATFFYYAFGVPSSGAPRHLPPIKNAKPERAPRNFIMRRSRFRFRLTTNR